MSFLHSNRISGISALAAAVAGALVLMAGCDDSKPAKTASQVAAKVNKEEISVHQINFVLQRQPGVSPDRADGLREQILERLIDQELAIQKAEEFKIPRDPDVLTSLEAARREIIARAYADKVSQTASRPTREEVRKYYAEHPELFKDRRVYQFQEILVEVPQEQAAALSERLKSAKTPSAIVDLLKASNVRSVLNQAFRGAEQLPLKELKTFAAMRDGESIVNRSANGLQVITLLSSRPEPLTEEQAQAPIEQFLLNERKRELLDKDRAHLRSTAHIEYVGKFDKANEGTPIAPDPAGATASSAKPLDASPQTGEKGK